MIRKPVVHTLDDQLTLLNPKKPVRVYRNLHTGLWSVKQGVVRFHTPCIFLKNVNFLVSESGRQRVLREQKKYVHASVEGIVCQRPTYYDNYEEVTYDPYKNKQFVCPRGEAISADACSLVRLSDGKMRVYASNILLTSWDTAGILDTVPVHLL